MQSEEHRPVTSSKLGGEVSSHISETRSLPSWSTLHHKWDRASYHGHSTIFSQALVKRWPPFFFVDRKHGYQHDTIRADAKPCMIRVQRRETQSSGISKLRGSRPRKRPRGLDWQEGGGGIFFFPKYQRLIVGSWTLISEVELNRRNYHWHHNFSLSNLNRVPPTLKKL